VATRILRRAIADDSAQIPHRAIVEFVSVVTRSIGRRAPLLSQTDAIREAEDLLTQFTVIYPTEEVVRLALRGMARSLALGLLDQARVDELA
jgi:hypothetical protein